MEDLQKMSTEELFQIYSKLPDFDRFPLPDKFYKMFNIKKPKPLEINEILTYTAPPHESLNKDGKIEIRGVAEGGVRSIELAPELPVKVELTPDDTENENAVSTNACASLTA